MIFVSLPIGQLALQCLIIFFKKIVFIHGLRLGSSGTYELRGCLVAKIYNLAGLCLKEIARFSFIIKIYKNLW